MRVERRGRVQPVVRAVRLGVDVRRVRDAVLVVEQGRPVQVPTAIITYTGTSIVCGVGSAIATN